MALTVLQIIPNMGAGGAEQACIDIAAGLVARGDRALVVSNGGDRVNEIERVGGIHITLPVHSKNPLVMASMVFRVAQLIKNEKVDIIHARSRAPAWVARGAAAMTGCRFVTTFHAAYKFSHAVKRFYNSVMARAERVIAISDYVADHIHENYGISRAKIKTVYRGIDRARFAKNAVSEEKKALLRLQWKLGAADRVILVPGRLSPIKGQALAIEAMAAVVKEPDLASVVMIIVGDDQGRAGYRTFLESQIFQQALQDRVRIVGHCKDMPTALALADLVLVPSRVPEGFGRVPVEAQAMGVPVIASDLGATRETVRDAETGWLLPPDQPKLWASTIIRALRLSAEQRAEFAAKAQPLIETRFTRERMVQATLDIYDELMSHV